MATVFEIAQGFQNKIENDTQYANRFETAFRDNMLARDGVGAQLSQNRLDVLQNEFDANDLRQNGAARLANNGLAEQYTGLKTRYEIDNFGNVVASDNLTRQLGDMETQYGIDNFQTQKELKDAQDALDLKERNLKIRETETRLETITNDKVFTDLQASVEGIEGAEKYREMYKIGRSQKISPSIRKRIDEELQFDIAEDVESFSLLDDFIATPSGAKGSAQSLKKQTLLGKFDNAYRSMDRELISLAISKGIINENDMHPVLFMAITEGADNFTQFIQDKIAEEEAGSVDPVTGDGEVFSDGTADAAFDLDGISETDPFPEELATPQTTTPQADSGTPNVTLPSDNTATPEPMQSDTTSGGSIGNESVLSERNRLRVDAILKITKDSLNGNEEVAASRIQGFLGRNFEVLTIEEVGAIVDKISEIKQYAQGN